MNEQQKVLLRKNIYMFNAQDMLNHIKLQYISFFISY